MRDDPVPENMEQRKNISLSKSYQITQIYLAMPIKIGSNYQKIVPLWLEHFHSCMSKFSFR